MDKYAGADTSKAHFDLWTIIQLGLLGAVALRALLRLTKTRSIRLTAPVRSVIKYAIALGLLFAVSVVWSPGRAVSLAYTVIYFLILICVAEFLVDTYRKPPDWMQCLFAMRLVSLLLMSLVAVAVVVTPTAVLIYDRGIRLAGGSIGIVHVLCPFIAVVSAYSYLYSFEPRRSSITWFFVGFVGSMLTRSRGAEIALFLVLCILGITWARRNLRSASFFATIALMASLFATFIFATEIAARFGKGLTGERMPSSS